MEPISPELVLVDPELAARVRASAVAGPAPHLLRSTKVAPFSSESPPWWPVRAPEAPDATAPTVRRRAFRRARRSLVAVGLLVSGFFAGAAISGSGTQRPQFVLEEPAATGKALEESRSAGTAAAQLPSSAGRTKGRVRPAGKAQRRPRPRARAGTAARRRQTRARLAAERTASAAVERRLLSLIVHSPAGKLPPALIDEGTGLAKNNLQAVCTRSDDRHSFLCVVTSALQPAAPPMYALYRPTNAGRGGFTWYRSRAG